MANIKIISNNPLVLDQYAAVAQTVPGGVYEVYCTARDAIHSGSRLINHPLSGSVKPNQNPYRSLVLSLPQATLLDFTSLSLIEEALATLRKLPVLNRHYEQRVLDDFQVIDLDLLAAAIKALPAEFHL